MTDAEKAEIAKQGLDELGEAFGLLMLAVQRAMEQRILSDAAIDIIHGALAQAEPHMRVVERNLAQLAPSSHG